MELDEEDLKTPILRQAARRTRDGLTVLPYLNRKCQFLIDNKCKIYNQRPKLCREFRCTECLSFNRFLVINPQVVQLLMQFKPCGASCSSTSSPGP